MYSYRIIGVYGVISFIFLVKLCACDEVVCDRRPLGTKTDPLPPDNQFFIDINVRLQSRDEKSTFIAFTISLREDSIPNRDNPRKPTFLKAGRLELLLNSTNTKYHQACKDTIVETDITAKTFVEVLWNAPEKDNKCVTIFAVVAVKPNVWYNFDGPLSKRVCEDRRKAEDMQPMENDNCQVCEDARYQLTFEGMWSFNTHPLMFPNGKAEELARFSDVVGASHSKEFSLYKYTLAASLGLQMLAEQGNTTQLEIEIQKQLGKDVRTVLKATGPPKTYMSTVTSFRATRKHHLVSLATGLLPSPDWFLGVANFELCDVKTGQWADSVRYNMYPMDAGTDKGLTFDAANEEMSPHQPVSPIVINKDVPKEQVKPFAKLHFDLIRTYSSPNCTMDTGLDGKSTEDDNDGDYDGNGGDTTNGQEITIPAVQTTTTSEEPPAVDPESSVECPMSTWGEWLPCEGECVGGRVAGVQIRFRYHMVDDVAVGVYNEHDPTAEDKEIPEDCLDENKYPVSETGDCEETCEEEEEEAEAIAERRIWRREPIRPGRNWGRK